jgi:hypothetical protein
MSLPALTLLQAYGELIGKHPEYTDRYFAVLNELEHSDPGNPLVQGAIGNRSCTRESTKRQLRICSAR